MKSTFENLPEDKKTRVMEAAVDEFGIHGYKSGSTDRIIRKASISKGGLYEYISSKSELYIASVEYAYNGVYGYLHTKVDNTEKSLRSNLLDRLRIASSYAAEVYLQHPRYIQLLARAGSEDDTELQQEIENIFKDRFNHLFDDVDADNFAFPKHRVFDLVRTLLVKTRNEFLSTMKRRESEEEIVAEYLACWDFYLKVLQSGIFREN